MELRHVVPGSGLHNDRELNSGRNAKLPERVAEMCFHGLGAQEKRRGDLGVRFSRGDQAGDLEFSFGQLLDPDSLNITGPCASMNAVAELAQLAHRLGSVTLRAEFSKGVCCLFERVNREVLIACLRQSNAHEESSPRGVEAVTHRLRKDGGMMSCFGRRGRMAGVEIDGGGGEPRHGRGGR